ncbi:uncharacterized protein PgNI_07316 [Pyricularia grisea]|uniref:Uncharacterized protein n=1 Tax=Pyricularia grisea TaxID=148305 RepID=A0A6P8B1G4_PYRGI|nr:uncharacterized protein PgNI_07316 [Pyricularia grisea]TLD08676.1 hypothetical protein PgNI_07316 [Pyricularia grisea]
MDRSFQIGNYLMAWGTSGSTNTKRSIMDNGFGGKKLFEDLWAEFKSRYKALVREMDENQNLVMDRCIDLMTAGLDILSKQNARRRR